MAKRKIGWKEKCTEIWKDEDGWWAMLKSGYYWGTDNQTGFNGETYRELCEAAQDIHEGLE